MGQIAHGDGVAHYATFLPNPYKMHARGGHLLYSMLTFGPGSCGLGVLGFTNKVIFMFRSKLGLRAKKAKIGCKEKSLVGARPKVAMAHKVETECPTLHPLVAS